MNQLVPATPGQSLVCLITADHQGLGQCLVHSRDSCADLYPSGSVTFLRKKQLASRPRRASQEGLQAQSQPPAQAELLSSWLAGPAWCLADTEPGRLFLDKEMGVSHRASISQAPPGSAPCATGRDLLWAPRRDVGRRGAGPLLWRPCF